jgi:hypothetical protein
MAPTVALSRPSRQSVCAAKRRAHRTAILVVLGSSPNGGRSDVGAFVRLAEKPVLDKLFEQRLACDRIHVPQTTRLRASQLQPWHLGILTANPGDDGIQPQCIGGVLKILSIGHERCLVMRRIFRYSW